MEATLYLQTTREAAKQVVDKVNDILQQTSCPEDVRRNIDVVLDEVCSNIADYAYPATVGDFKVVILTGENQVQFTFSDYGISFNPLEQEQPPLPGELSIGGWGIYFITSLMDKVEYVRVADENQLYLVKSWA